MQKISLVAAVVLLVVILATAALSLYSWKRPQLGTVEGRLRPCPGGDNCVSSMDAGEHAMPPLSFEGDPKDAWQRLQAILRSFKRARLVAVEDAYLHAEFSSAVFRFVDDVEFLLDAEQKRIHFRSASRVGRSDLGANRKRMEQIAEAWERAD